MGREGRLVRIHRQDQPVISQLLDVAAVAARPSDGIVAAIRFQAANLVVASLLRIRTSIWCGGKCRQGRLPGRVGTQGTRSQPARPTTPWAPAVVAGSII